MTTVIHARDLAPGDVYIGRRDRWGKFEASPWANPYRIGPDGTRAEVVEKYRPYIAGRPDLLARLGELKGKRLACWCAPEACHGDVLAELADRDPQEIDT